MDILLGRMVLIFVLSFYTICEYEGNCFEFFRISSINTFYSTNILPKTIQPKTHLPFRQPKKVDQFWRNEHTNLQNGEPVSTNLNEDQISEKMGQTDSLIHFELKKIIEQFGFSGFDLVGKR